MWPALIAAATAPLWVPPIYKGLRGGIDEVLGTDLSGERSRELALSRYKEGLGVDPFLQDEAALMEQEGYDELASLMEEDYDPYSGVRATQEQLALSEMLNAHKGSLAALSIKDDGRPSFEEIALRMGLTA